jgi:hypothetical protein
MPPIRPPTTLRNADFGQHREDDRGICRTRGARKWRFPRVRLATAVYIVLHGAEDRADPHQARDQEADRRDDLVAALGLGREIARARGMA